MTELRYIGGGAWLPGIPASDHAEPDDKRAAELIASGLYERADKKTAKPLAQAEVLTEPDKES